MEKIFAGVLIGAISVLLLLGFIPSAHAGSTFVLVIQVLQPSGDDANTYFVFLHCDPNTTCYESLDLKESDFGLVTACFGSEFDSKGKNHFLKEDCDLGENSVRLIVFNTFTNGRQAVIDWT